MNNSFQFFGLYDLKKVVVVVGRRRGVRGPGTPANEGLDQTQHYIDFNKMLHVYYTIIKTRENIIAKLLKIHSGLKKF